MRRINLLPREVEARRRQRRQTSLLVAVGIIWLVLLGLFWFYRQGQLREQEDQRAEAEARVTELQAQINALDRFARLDEKVKAKDAALTQAMANDVGWSTILLELAMVTPGDVWLTGVNGSATPPSDPTPATAAKGPKYGTITFSAVTFDFPGVARFLTRMTIDEFQSLWVPNASKAKIGARDVVNFQSTADLSAEALSGRYQQGGGK